MNPNHVWFSFPPPPLPPPSLEPQGSEAPFNQREVFQIGFTGLFKKDV